MINVAAHRIKQYGVEFYQASFSAREITSRRSRSSAGSPETSQAPRRPDAGELGVLESRIGETSAAYQRR
jgi:hypothetical protein